MLNKTAVLAWSIISAFVYIERPERFVDNGYTLRRRPSNVANPFAAVEVPVDFDVIQKLLTEERNASKVYDEIWKEAEDELKIRKTTISPKYFKAGTPDECYIAVIAYTLDTDVTINGTDYQLYRDFNRRFRQLTDEASWRHFPYKSLYYLLVKAVPGIRNVPNPNRDLYRGVENFHFDPVPKVGDTFYFDSFASCSTDRATAVSFMDDDGTLIELDGGAAVAIGIAEYSSYDEEEVLVFPKNKFRVKKFQRNATVDFLRLERAGVLQVVF